MSEEFEGIRIQNPLNMKSIGIHHLPHWKQWCLYEEDAHGYSVLAFVKEDEDAEKIADWLETLANSKGMVDGK